MFKAAAIAVWSSVIIVSGVLFSMQSKKKEKTFLKS